MRHIARHELHQTLKARLAKWNGFLNSQRGRKAIIQVARQRGMKRREFQNM